MMNGAEEEDLDLDVDLDDEPEIDSAEEQKTYYKETTNAIL